MRLFILVSLVLGVVIGAAQDNYMRGADYECVKCLCHARSGCHIRQNCARYSIGLKYWKEAGRLQVKGGGRADEYSSYRRCIQDENCIVGTILAYTNRIKLDCNCDGVFDCKDRLMIHLSGYNCNNHLLYNNTFAHRYNSCASKVNTQFMEEGDYSDTCTPIPQ